MFAWMVESVDTWDLKSHGFIAVSVQVRLQVPFFGALAQLEEHLSCTQKVSGSIPLSSTIKTLTLIY